MVAPALQPPAATAPVAPTPLHGVPAAKGAAKSGASASAYDLTTAQADFTTWRTNLLNYMTTTLIPLDNYYEQRQPTTPYYAVAGQTVRQYVSPLIRNGVDGVLAYVRPESIRISCPLDENPGASADECADAEGALRFVFDFHIRKRIANILETIKWFVAVRGAAMVQISWLSPQDQAAYNKKFPIRMDVHDIFDCAWHIGEDDQVKQVLILKKKSASQVPADWLAQVGITDTNAEVDVLEYWDETASGAVINGQIVKPLAPHGYTDLAGDPACPVVFIPHAARRQRLGGVAPLASGVSQRGIEMGTPIAEALLPRAEDDSRLKTRLFYYTDLAMRGLLVAKGVVMRDGKAVIDFDAGVAELEDSPDSKLDWLAAPQVSNAFGMLADMVAKDAAGAFASQATLAGDQPMNISGTSFNHQTTWSRARAESFAISLEDGYTSICHILAGMMRANLVATAATHFRKQMKRPLPLRRDPTKPGQSSFDQGVVLPLYKGGGVRDIDNLTFQYITKIVVAVEPDTRTPQETEVQQAIGLAAAPNPIMSLAWIRAEKMHSDNPQGEANQIALEKMEADPTTPWGLIRSREAMVDSYLTELDDPAQRQTILAALDQFKQQTILQALVAPPGAGQPPQPGAPPFAGPPGGPPPGMPAPTGPPPGTPPPNQGQPPNPPFPGQFAPPNALPPGPMGGAPMQPGPLLGTPPPPPPLPPQGGF